MRIWWGILFASMAGILIGMVFVLVCACLGM